MKPDCVEIAHGGGGRRSAELIRDEIVARFGGGPLDGLPDAATLPEPGGPIVFSTDSFVVSPVEFPGGNIGHLAVHGTVNDVAVAGGRPRWLSLGLILEEGLSLEVLRRVLDAVQAAAMDCGVTVATGDTKVVARGQCDGLYINTSGIGTAWPGLKLSPARMQPGDAVLVSGGLGDHGMAVMAARGGIGISGGPISDTGPVHRLVESVVEIGLGIRFMRDPTRGGLAAVLNEAVQDSSVGIELDESSLPASPGARAVAEMLGLDLLHVASEGRVVVVCAADASDEVLRRFHERPEGAGAKRVGTVSTDAGRVTLQTLAGGRRLVDVPLGELLPRIC